MAITSPEDQKVTFVELFFDLVFVFSVTQIVKLLNEGHDWIAVGQSILIFWLVWWTWSQLNWEIHPQHFAERHGLLVTIAIGETSQGNRSV